MFMPSAWKPVQWLPATKAGSKADQRIAVLVQSWANIGTTSQIILVLRWELRHTSLRQ